MRVGSEDVLDELHVKCGASRKSDLRKVDSTSGLETISKPAHVRCQGKPTHYNMVLGPVSPPGVSQAE